MKESDYNLMIMVTYGAFISNEDARVNTLSNRVDTFKLKYTKVIDNHYTNQRSIDYYNINIIILEMILV